MWLAADVDLSDINCLVNPRWRAINSVRRLVPQSHRSRIGSQVNLNC